MLLILTLCEYFALKKNVGIETKSDDNWPGLGRGLLERKTRLQWSSSLMVLEKPLVVRWKAQSLLLNLEKTKAQSSPHQSHLWLGYSDGMKNKAWQPLATLAAADCVLSSGQRFCLQSLQRMVKIICTRKAVSAIILLTYADFCIQPLLYFLTPLLHWL